MFTSILARRRVAGWLLALAFAMPCAAIAATALPGPAHVIKSAACKGYRSGSANDDSSGCDGNGSLGGFVDAADAIVSPAVIAMAAITPIACLVGAGALMFGSRRGLLIIGAALGTLVFVVSVKGIVA